MIKNPKWLRFVKVESRIAYFGDPLPLLDAAISDVFECDKNCDDAATFIEKCQKTIERWNKSLESYGITLKLRKGSPFERHSRPYGLQITRKKAISPERKGKNLVDTYIEVQRSKTIEFYESSIWSELFARRRRHPKRALDYISRRRIMFDNQFNDIFSEMSSALERWANGLERSFSIGTCKEHRDESLFYLYGLVEIGNTFLSSFFDAYNGFFRASFKGYRDVIEIIALSIFIDSLNLQDWRLEENPYVDAVIDGWWHKAIVGSPEQKIINYGKFVGTVGNMLFGEKSELLRKTGLSREKVIQLLEHNMSTPLFMAMTGRVLCRMHAERDGVLKYSLSRDKLLRYLKEKCETEEGGSVLRLIISQVISKLPSRCQKECDAKDLLFTAKIPTTGALMQLSWKILALPNELTRKLQDKYDQYSWFVHPYLQTVQYHPFSSDLEVKLWAEETKDFIKLIDTVISVLMKKMETLCSRTKSS
jgi:hypothetical protein